MATNDFNLIELSIKMVINQNNAGQENEIVDIFMKKLV